jgi:hypothetical protein
MYREAARLLAAIAPRKTLLQSCVEKYLEVSPAAFCRQLNLADKRLTVNPMFLRKINVG